MTGGVERVAWRPSSQVRASFSANAEALAPNVQSGPGRPNKRKSCPCHRVHLTSDVKPLHPVLFSKKRIACLLWTNFSSGLMARNR